ncbi:MAG: L,D-transpeptidase [Gammaproteobacteria bacterium]|nr:L,D-transpeptidase [Gammaproteobacteria bacterium]
MLKRCIWLLMCGAMILSGCVQYDESTYITDDYGVVHHRQHYTLDKRGRDHFPLKIRPRRVKVFVFDPKVAAWAAYDKNGDRVMTGSASGGKDICEEDGKSCRTVTGSFRIYAKRGLDCKSGEYPVETEGGAKMPYCMYFSRGYTIHAGYAVPPYNDSHGCIRVLPSAAKWLNEEFATIGTRVVVLSYEDENGDGDWLQSHTSS